MFRSSIRDIKINGLMCACCIPPSSMISILAVAGLYTIIFNPKIYKKIKEQFTFKENIINQQINKEDPFMDRDCELPPVNNVSLNEDKQILNISNNESITKTLLNKKFREKILIYHPDLNLNSKESQLKTMKIIQAYKNLKNEEKTNIS